MLVVRRRSRRQSFLHRLILAFLEEACRDGGIAAWWGFFLLWLRLGATMGRRSRRGPVQMEVDCVRQKSSAELSALCLLFLSLFVCSPVSARTGTWHIQGSNKDGHCGVECVAGSPIAPAAPPSVTRCCSVGGRIKTSVAACLKRPLSARKRARPEGPFAAEVDLWQINSWPRRMKERLRAFGGC